MNNGTDGKVVNIASRTSRTPEHPLTSRPALLHWVVPSELEALHEVLAQGRLPADFLAKLGRMADGTFAHRFMEQNCRLFAALLMASEAGSFPDPSPAQRDRLLRVLAYVRAEDDAIPDYWEGGLSDDQREILAAIVELGGLLQTFKAWRLRHQVPGMWVDHEAKQVACLNTALVQPHRAT